MGLYIGGIQTSSLPIFTTKHLTLLTLYHTFIDTEDNHCSVPMTIITIPDTGSKFNLRLPFTVDPFVSKNSERKIGSDG